MAAAARPRRLSGSLSGSHHIGVIDIGSNSIRLVVFDSQARAPIPVFNEKVLCGLGRGLERTGRLDENGTRLALDNLTRFAALAEAMGVKRLKVLATAATRDAANGREFVAAVRKRTGLGIRILSGAEEARISALGVVSGMPDADGLMGDLGGGSLELVALRRERIGKYVTLPFGPLRLREYVDKGRGRLREMIDRRLDDLDWLDDIEGRDFYAVGGAWRALARLHMAHSNYPLHVIHNYVLSRGKAEEFCDVVARLGRDSLERMSALPRKRIDTLPIAALVLARILRRAKPARLVFSAAGLREGCLYEQLPRRVQNLDPLIAHCEAVARDDARFPIGGRELSAWVDPLFRKASAERLRLRHAACLLSDIAWAEHPDYRADIAFLRVLRMPLVGIDHPGRAFLALSVFTRYEGGAESDVTRPAWLLLDETRLREAYVLGLALRLAYTVSGGAPRVLRRVKLNPDGKTLKLIVPRGARTLVGEAVERRFEALARALGRKPSIKIKGG